MAQLGKKLVQLIGMNSLKSLRYEIIYFYFRHNYVDLLINIMRLEYINKYTYWEIVWWMDVIHDDWIKMGVVMIYNRSVVYTLVPIKIEETLLNFFLKFHNLRHIIQYLTLVKKCLRFHDIIFEDVTFLFSMHTIS